MPNTICMMKHASVHQHHYDTQCGFSIHFLSQLCPVSSVYTFGLKIRKCFRQWCHRNYQLRAFIIHSKQNRWVTSYGGGVHTLLCYILSDYCFCFYIAKLMSRLLRQSNYSAWFKFAYLCKLYIKIKKIMWKLVKKIWYWFCLKVIGLQSSILMFKSMSIDFSFGIGGQLEF